MNHPAAWRTARLALRPLGPDRKRRRRRRSPIGFGGRYQDPFDPGWGVEVAYFLRPAVWDQG